MKYIELKNNKKKIYRKIGNNYPPLVIAEIGINHNGSLKIAKEMVLSAKRAGIEVVKHQTHICDDEMSPQAKKVIPGNSKKSIYEIMESCALNEKDELELKEFIEDLGLIFLSTPFSRAAADRLESFEVSGYKIGSGEMNNYPLIKHIVNFKKPLIISTGMNSLNEVKKLVALLESLNAKYALMHTTNLYPTPFNLVRLGSIKQMQEVFNVPIGLSDHTINNNACKAAFALGANLVERHFTDKKDRQGPDIVCSMDEFEAKDLVDSAFEIYSMLGGKKEVLREEQITIDFAYSTCVSIKKINKGDKLSMENIWVKRPYVKNGIKAEHFEDILGKIALVDIPNNTHIELNMIQHSH